MKWVSYFLTGAWDILSEVLAALFVTVIFLLPIFTVVVIVMKLAIGKLIVDGQFNAIPEIIILAIYSIAVFTIHGKHLSE